MTEPHFPSPSSVKPLSPNPGNPLALSAWSWMPGAAQEDSDPLDGSTFPPQALARVVSDKKGIVVIDDDCVDDDSFAQSHPSADELHEASSNPDKEKEMECSAADDATDMTREMQIAAYMHEYATLECMRSKMGDPLTKGGRELYGDTLPHSNRVGTLGRFSPMLLLGPRWYVSSIAVVVSAIFAAFGTAALISHAHWAIIFAIWALYLMLVYFTVACAASNPGVVPRRVNRLREPVDMIPITVEVRKNPLCGYPVPVQFQLRFCRTCNIYRAPRSHHCSKCDNCVDYLDHHCEWTGSCIGVRNYHSFFGLLVAVHLFYALLFSSVTGFSIKFAYDRPWLPLMAVAKEFYYMIFFLYPIIFIAGFHLTGILITHCYMAVVGVTTVECLTRRFDGPPFNGANPWNEGPWRNIRNRAATALGPKHVNPALFTSAYRFVTVDAIIKEKQIDARVKYLARETIDTIRAAQAEAECRAGELRNGANGNKFCAKAQ